MNGVKVRGFEVVKDEARSHKDIAIILPTRADDRSSGYDFYSPINILLLPAQKTLLYTDVKAYMLSDEELLLFIRSSLAIKSGIMLSNAVGKVDASYYENEGNDGNIGIALLNTSGKTVQINEGDRVMQGSFYKYLKADTDTVLGATRTGGMGSSGK